MKPNYLRKPKRRHALKILGLLSLSASQLLANNKPTKKFKTDKKIIIVGGGTGAITILSRLLKSIQNPDITIIAPNEMHTYQPGQVYVATGLYKQKEILRKNEKYIPKNVRWIKESVIKFDPQNNTLLTCKEQTLSYDYLIVATGLQYNFEPIKGLQKKDIGTNNICSVYVDGVSTWEWLNELKEQSQKKKQTVLYTMPNTPVKCGAVAQLMLYMSADYLKKEGLEAEYIYTPNAGRLFGLKPINDKLLQVQKRYKTITTKYHHNLIEVDIKNKIAVYEHNYEVKSGWDEDFEEWTKIEQKQDIVKIKYDFLHVVPPMFPTTAVANSKLAKSGGHYKGWLDVNRETMQHNVFKNVFGIGDICATPLGKTVPSAVHQAKTVEQNLLSAIMQQKLSQSYDGFSVCPVKIGFGEVIMAKFNYEGLIDDTINNTPNAAKKWWLHDVYEAKKDYWNTLLKGKV